MKGASIISSILFSCFVAQLSYGQGKKKSGLKNLLGVNVETMHDEFEGTTTYRMKGNTVKIKGQKAKTVITGVTSFFNKRKNFKVPIATTRLQLENHILNDSVHQLAVILKVSVEDNGTFKVMQGKSLIFLADGARIALETDGSFNTDSWTLDGDSKTHARYPITKKQIEDIIRAETVMFRIMQDSFENGQAEARDKEETSFEGSFSPKNFDAWTDFYDDYIVETL